MDILYNQLLYLLLSDCHHHLQIRHYRHHPTYDYRLHHHCIALYLPGSFYILIYQPLLDIYQLRILHNQPLYLKHHCHHHHFHMYRNHHHPKIYYHWYLRAVQFLADNFYRMFYLLPLGICQINICYNPLLYLPLGSLFRHPNLHHPCYFHLGIEQYPQGS